MKAEYYCGLVRGLSYMAIRYLELESEESRAQLALRRVRRRGWDAEGLTDLRETYRVASAVTARAYSDLASMAGACGLDVDLVTSTVKSASRKDLTTLWQLWSTPNNASVALQAWHKYNPYNSRGNIWK